jgi:hypothetical protein
MVHALAAAITDVNAATATILTPRQRCIAPGWLHQECASSKLRTKPPAFAYVIVNTPFMPNEAWLSTVHLYG